MEKIQNNLPIDDYHKGNDHLSSTALRKARKSLKLFKMYQEGYFEEEKKSHFDFGNAFELALLEPDSFDRQVVIYNEDERPEKDKGIASKINQEWKKSLYDTSKYVIKKDGRESFEVIEQMLRSCYADAVIQSLLKNIEYQYSMFWTDKETGLKLKTRPDICRSKKNVVVDVKTALDGSPEAVTKAIGNTDLPFQAVMQIDGVVQSGFMEKVDNYFWLVVEKEPPFSATLYEFQQEDIKWCMDEYRYVLSVVKEAIEKNHYPSYSYRADNKYGILQANIPLWYRNYGL